MKNILAKGGAGFIISNLIKCLFAVGERRTDCKF